MRRSLKQSLRNLRSAAKGVARELTFPVRRAGDLPRAVRGRTELKLNIACGQNVEPGWINIDLQPDNPLVLYFNALDPLPLPESSVRRIHCEHFLEHLELHDAAEFLKECRRVLQPGGSMRVIVPDLEKYISAYAAKNRAYFDQLRDLGNPSKPLETPAMVINQMSRMGHDHRFAWDFETLSHVARRAGFASVERSAKDLGPAEFAVDGRDSWREVESLYVELC